MNSSAAYATTCICHIKKRIKKNKGRKKLPCKKTKRIKNKTYHHQMKKRKKICIRKTIRVVSKPTIHVVTPQGVQGPAGPQGIQGPAGPPGFPGTGVTGISIIPSVQRYFTFVPSDMAMTTSRTFAANQFVNDSGEPVTQFTDHGRFGYFNLYINAVLQEGELYSVHSNALTIQPTGQTIRANTPIILESVGFTAEIITNHGHGEH